MARRTSAYTNGPNVNGSHNVNGDAPPPSTLAAQIVQNQTRTDASPEKATFAGLLHEILHNPDAAPETDIAVNVQLITVVVEAGLSTLIVDNPFAERDVLIPQAVDSVAVIKAAVTRQPETLFAPISPDGPQLLLWLVARLVAVCGRQHCRELPVADLLTSIVGTLSKSTKLWRSASMVQSLMRDCVDDVLKSLSAARKTAVTDFSATLPPAKWVAKLWPESENAIALSHDCQSSIKGVDHGLMLALIWTSVNASPPRWLQDTQLKLQIEVAQLRTYLLKTDSSESIIKFFLGGLHGIARLRLMDQLLKESIVSTLAPELQNTMAEVLVELLRDGSPSFDVLTSAVAEIGHQENFDQTHESLRIAVAIWLGRFLPEDEQPQPVRLIAESIREGNFMTDNTLLSNFQEDPIYSGSKDEPNYPRKRRRISGSNSPHDTDTHTSINLCRLLIGTDTPDLSGLKQASARSYSKLSEAEQCTVWQLLANLVDRGCETASLTRLVFDLLGSSEQQPKPARVLSMRAVESCARRSIDPALLDLGSSHAGQFCLRSLHSSVRELRVAAGHCLPAFLREDIAKVSEDLLSRNRHVAFQHLRALSERDVASELETLITAWGRVALVSGDEELNLVLLQLVGLLAHTNPIVSGLAFSEIESIADATQQSVERLLTPFWSSIAFAVVQDLHQKPQKIQQLCDLLRMEVNQFLLMTQHETIPYLVLHRKKDVLQRIATARGEKVVVQDICLQPRSNLAAILALLFAQPSSDVEGLALESLIAVAPSFQSSDLASLVRTDPAIIACQLLKYIGDQTESRKSRAYQAFQIFVNVAEGRAGQKRTHSKASRTLAAFFETHILGIMANISEVLAKQSPSNVEKERCLKGIAEMVTLAKENVSVALPQIRACLQSAIEVPELCQAAWAAWLSLLPTLDSEYIALIAGQTFALIVRHWASFAPDLQQITYDRVTEMVKEHNNAINDNVMTLPSLSGIPVLTKLGSEIERLQKLESVEGQCKGFAKRLKGESHTVVVQALTELVPFLESHQAFIQDAAASEQPEPWLSNMLRALLDTTVAISDNSEAADLCGKCLGLVGCLDPNRIDASRPSERLLVLSNFDAADEVIAWVVVFLENVLVTSFKSVNNARSQGFLAYVMQELLRFCGFDNSIALRRTSTQGTTATQRWMDMSESVRTTLTPFLTSKYIVTSNVPVNLPNRKYPGFAKEDNHNTWLRSLVYDLMWKAKGDNANMIFPLLARIVKGHDLSIASFLLPYTLTNVVLGGTVAETTGIRDEIIAVLRCQATNAEESDNIRSCSDNIRLCSESIFSALDYMSVWLQEKRKMVGETRANAYRTGNSANDVDEITAVGQIETIEQFLATIPAEDMATRAMECGSYARALFNWEQYIRQSGPLIPSQNDVAEKREASNRLMEIYAQIDEPDGLEGISAHLKILTDEQQATLHARSGRWTAAQAWYEQQIVEEPENEDLQISLLECFRETGRYAPLLRYADSFIGDDYPGHSASPLYPLAIEACCMTGEMSTLERRLDFAPEVSGFEVDVGRALHASAREEPSELLSRIANMRRAITAGLSAADASSLQTCHTELRKLHILHEMEAVSTLASKSGSVEGLLAVLEKRLNAVGSYLSDKQTILGIRRAAMANQSHTFSQRHIGASWLTTARLARKAGNTESAYNAVLKAYAYGEKAAKLEEARLLWRDGHGRRAIQGLEAAIAAKVFDEETDGNEPISEPSRNPVPGGQKQNMLLAKAHLLLAKWLDVSEQTQTKDMTAKYQYAARTFQRWEKGHYYLGKHYNKLLEAEKALPKHKQSNPLLTGDLTRLVVENLLRSIPFGTKYWHETIPKVLTLWLDLGMTTLTRGTREDKDVFEKRQRALQSCHRQFKKYFERVPPYIFYQALPQMLSRISHPHPEVWKELTMVITKIVATHPSQALWSLLAVTKATDRVRKDRAIEIVNRLKDPKTKSKEGPYSDLRTMLVSGQRLADGLLQASEAPVEPRASHASLAKDLGFNHKLVPCNLVVPLEMTLTASMPASADSVCIRGHKAFAQDKITIQAFEDSFLVLSSLQRPKKVVVRGSDGKRYGLLCKPKDDLRKDQRLMEFNGVINRALKRDAESSKRRLYIKTYAVIPLSEESGILEWVEGIKPVRDILLGLYGRKGIRPNYNEIRTHLAEACKSPNGGQVFNDRVMTVFPPVLHEWFAEVYPEPDAWFAARLRYARTAAVMSMTGHVLGLGDRHGENILLQESTGGVFHVDFNCLFDKGLTFEKPEVVPFRLTRNMVDAMGPYGAEGPFRRSCELTLGLLRQNKDTLNTILETFLYDPTTDFVGKKKRHTEGVPQTPQEILDSVRGKLKGLYKQETVPLGVEGYVDALIREAVDPWNLCQMYIGWCAFL